MGRNLGMNINNSYLLFSDFVRDLLYDNFWISDVKELNYSWLLDNLGDFNFIGVIIVIVSEALHTHKVKPYGCAVVVTCRAHALGLGCYIMHKR